MKRQIFFTILLSAVLLLSNLVSIAQEEIPQVTLIATAEGLQNIPTEMPEGLVNITFNNQSEAPILPVPMRLLEDVTRDELVMALETEGEDAAMALLAMLGGTFIMPETSITITYDLKPGEYLVTDFAYPSEAPILNWFMVEDSASSNELNMPEADINVNLLDFAFQIPLELEAGESLWHIENMGGQWHELVLIRVEDGITLEAAREMFFGTAPEGNSAEQGDHDHANAESTEEASAEEEGPMPDFLWIPMEAGEQAWIPVNLEAGTYVVACMLPNLEELGTEAEPHMHAELGMFQIVTVK